LLRPDLQRARPLLRLLRALGNDRLHRQRLPGQQVHLPQAGGAEPMLMVGPVDITLLSAAVLAVLVAITQYDGG
jgi:hypothetical protein